MAGFPTVRGAGEILRCFFGQSTTPPAAFYLALIREIPPNAFISGDELDEPVAADYARAEISNDTVNWNAPFMNSQLQVVSNQLDIEFGEAEEDWGSIGYWALTNAATGGYVYFYGQLESYQNIQEGDQAVVASDELVIEFSGFTRTEITSSAWIVPAEGSD